MTPPMSDNWHQTNQVVMAVQTAEIKQSNLTAPPELHLSCNLVNIARGRCNAIVTAAASADSDTEIEVIGSLTIEVNRPVMLAELSVPMTLWDLLVARLAAQTPRPLSLQLTIARNLAVSIKGDLRIDEKTKVDIADIAFTLPLK
tara:strand:+ start:1828 stop:2262 length:435 start_codon:yes stop_codon:yes gene_type:complete